MIPSLTSEKANDCPLLGDRDVGRGDESSASAEGVSLDESDHGRGARVDRVEHPPERVRVGHVLIVCELRRVAHPLDVGSRAEALPVACEHDRASLADVDERLRKLLDQRGVERVPRVGTRERDPEEIVVPFDPQRVHVSGV